MASLVVCTEAARSSRWVAAVKAASPALDVREWPEIGERSDIEYVLAWLPPQELFDGLTRLKAIFSIGAGVDHLLGDLKLPEGVPVIRMTDALLTEGITDFVLYNVLKFHREFDRYDALQREQRWQQHAQVSNANRRVGVMGLGVLGADAAAALVSRGFDVAGWSRSRKSLTGVESFAGNAELDAFLARTDILVCLLPLTSDTRDILNEQTLSKLPRGACVINAARGGHADIDAIVGALDSGQLRAVALDVFKTEPLPGDSPLWTDERVVITPHAASLTLPETAAARIAANIELIENGQQPRDVADLSRGY